jgi:putative heme-binding domain-containing protein
MLIAAATDPSPKVRIEAVRGLSFFRGNDCTDAVLAAAKMPMDYWMQYVVKSTLGATQASWSTRFLTKQIGQDKETSAMLGDIIKAAKAGGEAVPHLTTLLGADPATEEQKNKAMAALAAMKGIPEKGKLVWRNAGCVACHKVGTEGQDYGPELTKIASKMGVTRFKLVESIINPNAEIDEKYRSTKVEKTDGSSVSGLLISKPGEYPVVIFDGKEKKTIKKDDVEKITQLKQSSMPEGLAGTISPAEFLDLIEFLASLK